MAAKKSSKPNDVENLKNKIKKLEEENMKLKSELKTDEVKKQRSVKNFFRQTAVVLFVALSVVSFFLFNVASWSKNTILDTDTFVKTMQPVIAEPVVQKTLQRDITDSLFEAVDVQAELQKALPENIAFLSGPLSSQIESFTSNKVGEVLASKQVYDLWGTLLGTIQSKVVAYIEDDANDGVISVNDVYAVVTSRISADSKLSFLTNKQLPERVGTVTLAEVSWLPEARKYVDAISIAPSIFLAVSVISFFAAFGLAKNRRMTVMVLLGLLIVAMISMLASLYIASMQLVNNAPVGYEEFSKVLFNTIMTPLKDRTVGYASLFGAIFLIMFVTAKINWIIKTRLFIDSNLLELADKALPNTTVPSWLMNVSTHIAVISWTVFIVLFVVIGVRIPPSANTIITAMIWASITTAILYLLHVIVRAISMQRSSK